MTHPLENGLTIIEIHSCHPLRLVYQMRKLLDISSKLKSLSKFGEGSGSLRFKEEKQRALEEVMIENLMPLSVNFLNSQPLIPLLGQMTIAG